MGRSLSRTVTALCAAAAMVGGPGASQAQIGQGYNNYEIRYGAPEEHSLDENPRGWPEGQSIRTVGILNRRPQPQGPRSGGAAQASPRIYYLHRQFSVVLNPVPEIADRIASDGPTWLGREVEVVGVFKRADAIEFAAGQGTSETLMVWSMLVLEEQEDDGFDAPRSGIDALVMDTDAAAGKEVMVTGTYRGANLLEDLPADSRRGSGDWVLNDGPFSIWVTGIKPEGDGFSLGLHSRSDLRWELAVQGEVEIHDGYVYLKAEKVRLVGPARESE